MNPAEQMLTEELERFGIILEYANYYPALVQVRMRIREVQDSIAAEYYKIDASKDLIPIELEKLGQIDDLVFANNFQEYGERSTFDDKIRIESNERLQEIIVDINRMRREMIRLDNDLEKLYLLRDELSELDSSELREIESRINDLEISQTRMTDRAIATALSDNSDNDILTSFDLRRNDNTNTNLDS